MNSREKRLVGAAMASHALAHFFEQTFPPVLKLVENEYHLGLAGAGGLANVFPFFFGFGAIPAGMVVDRWGVRRTLLTYLLACSAAAVATLFVKDIWILALLLGIMGLAAGLYHPAGATMISKNVEQVGTGLGFHGMGGNLGLAVAPLFASVVAAALGWRAAYAVLALPALLLAAYFFKTKDLENHRGVSPEADPGASENSTVEQGPESTLWLPLILLFAMGMFNGFCYRGLLTFLPTFFSGDSTGEKALIEGGMLTTAVLLVGVFGQYGGGRLSDRFKPEVVYAISFTLGAPLIGILGLMSGSGAVAVAGAFSLMYFTSQPPGNSIVAKLSSHAFRGRAYGIFFFMHFGVGSFSATVSGWIGENYGVEAIFPFLGAVLAIVAVVGWILVAIMRTKKELA